MSDEGTRTFVVTGGGTGIGRAVAQRLADDGCSVLVTGRRRDVLERTAATINARYGSERVGVFVGDAADAADVGRLADVCSAGIDGLVLNAGGNVSPEGDDLDALASHWEATWRLNVLTTVLTAEALLGSLRRPGGRIVAISSVAALRGSSGSGPGAAYGAAKGAVNTWATGLAAELAPVGITVNVVAPGFVPDTGFWDAVRSDEMIARRTAGIPTGRPGTPAEVAEAVAYLGSPAAGFTTGQVLGVHGGTVLARL